MAALNRNTLNTGKVRADFSPAPAADKAPVRILQIGDGNFLRGFADWLVDVTNGAGLFNGRVTIAQPLDRGIADMINAQDGLYTVLLRGVQGGQTFESRRIISCVDSALNPYAQWNEMLALAGDPTLRFVISNTTEAGIAHVEEAFGDACPNSFPAKVASLLWARFQKLGGTVASGLVFLPCELMKPMAASCAASCCSMPKPGSCRRHSWPGSRSTTTSAIRWLTASFRASRLPRPKACLLIWATPIR